MDQQRDLVDRRVLIALSGGIACYKVPPVVSALVQRGASVRVIMTPAATRFVGPITFQALAGSAVLTDPWQSDDAPESQHIGVARWCEAMLIAPATADLIAKLAHGLCDDIVSLTAAALPRDEGGQLVTPLLLAPAMNADMWASPIVQRNVETVREVMGGRTVGPNAGWQACRTRGEGRMSEPRELVEAVVAALLKRGHGAVS